ncbi:protein jagged-1a isoform X2 [Halyomorpha halys]|uniref:protein jagged-1a isoform X2 n=1 Tax=Halyomorpha halys TaxID=286706 RepID=UPI0006D4C768|nr:cysteine-rich motor neuron 1 protein-like isoform X2 [Halyomorpha halys]
MRCAVPKSGKLRVAPWFSMCSATMVVGRLSFSFVLPTLGLLILAWSVDGQANGRKQSFLDTEGLCIKDGSYFDSCNRCFCKKGNQPGCTYNQCDHQEVAPDVRKINRREYESKESLLNHKGQCIKDGSFLEDCNKCSCRKGNLPGCTFKKCYHKRETRADKINPSGRCKPGDKWKLDECNDCHCTHTGYASCSLNECQPKKKGKRSTQQSKMDSQGRCKPGDKWKLDECNSCTCTHTGYASCTLNDCKNQKRGKRTASIGKPLDVEKREANPWRVQGNSGNECRAGHSWKENCNSCFCSERGIAMCTDMQCPTPTPST